MRRSFLLTLSLMVLIAFPGIVWAADQCSSELTQAKAALKIQQSALQRSKPLAKGQDIQAPRAQAGSRQEIQAPRGQQDIQAPRNQDIQAPRSQDIQAPRSQQDIQAPRTQDIQAPRGQQDIQAPRVSKAAKLIREADAACKKGDATLATQKAKEARALLK